jgi:chromosome partitioning protein
MPKIITLAHQKGGVGKSTLAANLAASFKNNVRTAIMDVDPQGTITQLTKIYSDIDVIPYSENVAELNYEVIFIDTPPYLSENLLKILEFTDIVLIPTKAGIADLLAIRSTIDMVKSKQKANPKLKAAVVLNMVKFGTTLTEDVRKQIGEIDITLLKTQISDRVNFTRSIALSSAIYGIGDLKAEKEIDNLTREVLLMLNI